MSSLFYLNQTDSKSICVYLNRLKSAQVRYNEIEYDAIAINNENGYAYRLFTRDVNFIRTNEYKSVLTMVYTCTDKYLTFPNRASKTYRNHFCLYTGIDNTILVVLTETTRQLPDQDAVIEYHFIKPTNASIGFCCNHKWTISFDKCEYNNKPPQSFSKYTLYTSGEWWYYENGIILNGVHSNVAESVSCIIYLELHPMYVLSTNPLNRVMANPQNFVGNLIHQNRRRFYKNS